MSYDAVPGSIEEQVNQMKNNFEPNSHKRHYCAKNSQDY